MYMTKSKEGISPQVCSTKQKKFVKFVMCCYMYITSKYVPPHVNIFYCLGGITLTCFFSTSGYRI
ncbi:putative plastoquinol--plastocyanin reductase [Helianthus annuus]|uniref:Plastoquinol--plastocyanin reductase n=1 Tax=Helianthus annuus TaxID=4232 RepID=A0A9K3JFS4_HELAN|nr:putative plastoquinol--plastocyanin reductase [Helianthus annuus]KAJ0592833.1 putative plastoquinol--plastocyanin reductase [Helianthus annuus]KAJ0607834.1 putative plastoquinol--plastocyanin reductase [Helianthus annuus]KAJ0767898.1 putative plastoquinol--plastocyanin reductase [Helianthus annuus]KAJ0935371.1 putative plastoquinol--plastocyanin reductase [Helianthus annuus]